MKPSRGNKGLSLKSNLIRAVKIVSGRNGRPSGVNFSRLTLRQIAEEAEWAFASNPTGQAEVAGLLLGTRGPIVEVSDATPVLIAQEPDRRYALGGPGSLAFRHAIHSLQSASNGERSVVGYYRSHIGKAFELTDDDRALLRAFFARTPAIALLTKLDGNERGSMRLFAASKNSRLKELHPEIETGLSGGNENNGSNDVSNQEAEPEDSFDRWSLRQIIGFAARVVLLGLLGYFFLQASIRWRNQTGPPSSPGTQTVAAAPVKLVLRVEQAGRNLRLSWNRTAPMLAEAREGTLGIREGIAPEREILLDGDLLRNGSIVCRPANSRAAFRLSVFGPAGEKIAESAVASP